MLGKDKLKSSQSSVECYTKTSWLKKPIVLFIVGSILIAIFLTWVAHFPSIIYKSKYYQIYCDTGQIGDTLGGIMGPPIAILGVILTFLAFYIQYQANAEQREQFRQSMAQQQVHFEKSLREQQSQFTQTTNLQNEESARQASVNHIEQTESRFFELLKIHKENVNEIQLAPTVSSRLSFEHMFRELKWLYFRLKAGAESAERTASDNKMNAQVISDMELIELAYTLFFYGIDQSSAKQYLKWLKPVQLTVYNDCIETLKLVQDRYEEHMDKHPTSVRFIWDAPIANPQDEFTVEFFYMPFMGHANRIGHLYRHLFQTCQFILKNNKLNFPKQKEYLKILRAQLSNFEQVMLYYNALVWFKKDWDKLFVDYQFIHNLPLDLIDMGPDVNELYKDEIAKVWKQQRVYIFEHQKNKPDKNNVRLTL